MKPIFFVTFFHFPRFYAFKLDQNFIWCHHRQINDIVIKISSLFCLACAYMHISRNVN